MVAIVSGIIVALLASSDDPEVALAVQIPVTTVETIPPSAPPPEPAPVEPAVTVPLEKADAGSGSAEEPPPAGLEEPGAGDDPPLTAGDVLPGAWPQDTEGYTIILASIPESRGRSEADSRASAARSAGLDEVGVLLSSSFSSLRWGYWVAFTGVHSTLNAARAELSTARAAGFPTAYTRRIAS
jgi:hypothetical protein